jgi:hypothetical protein
MALMQKFAIGVDPVRAEEHLEVPHHVRQDEEDQDEAADGHEILLAERRFDQMRSRIHQK